MGAGVDADYARGVMLVALAGVFWSIGGLLIRLIEAASGWQIVLFRSLALALTLTLIIALRHRGRLMKLRARLARARPQDKFLSGQTQQINLRVVQVEPVTDEFDGVVEQGVEVMDARHLPADGRGQRQRPRPLL